MAGLSEVAQKIVDVTENLGEVDLSGIRLDSVDPRLLDPGEMDLDRHVAVQASAIAYFGALKKEAGRRLAAVQRSYDRWQKKKYAEARVVAAKLTGAKSALKVEDVKAQYILDNEPEIEKWEKQLERAQQEYDTLDVWYEAWKTKGFSLREHVSMDNDERYSMTEVKGDDSQTSSAPVQSMSDRLARVRRIMKDKEGGE